MGFWQALDPRWFPLRLPMAVGRPPTFVAGEMRDARRDLSRGLLMGVAGVVILYLAVNFVCLRVLGPAGLDATTTPASDVMRTALG